jgi:hypothetical protein
MFGQAIDLNKHKLSNLLIDKPTHSLNILTTIKKHQNNYIPNITIDAVIINPLNVNNNYTNMTCNNHTNMTCDNLVTTTTYSTLA